MNDLIFKQAAIEVLATMQGLCTSKGALIQNSKIWQQIKDLPPAQPEWKWIPCSERLPEKCGVYLVSGSGRVWLCELVQMMTIRGWVNDARNPVVTAWMPLPKPYRKEGDE